MKKLILICILFLLNIYGNEEDSLIITEAPHIEPQTCSHSPPPCTHSSPPYLWPWEFYGEGPRDYVEGKGTVIETWNNEVSLSNDLNYQLIEGEIEKVELFATVYIECAEGGGWNYWECYLLGAVYQSRDRQCEDSNWEGMVEKINTNLNVVKLTDGDYFFLLDGEVEKFETDTFVYIRCSNNEAMSEYMHFDCYLAAFINYKWIEVE